MSAAARTVADDPAAPATESVTEPVAGLDTPAVVIDERVAMRNIERFQAHCDAKGLALRPHVKTHKLPHLAKAQLDAGARGITCQKISEAEPMADAGIDDILITFPIVGARKLGRLRALADRVRALSVVADDPAVVDGLAGAFEGASRPLTVLVECDTGAGRCGVQTPEAAAALAADVDARDSLAFGGLMTYPPVGGAARVTRFVAETLRLLGEAGIGCPTVSSGGSPDMWLAGDAPGVTEYRIGTYVYNDRSLVARGTATWDDCALTVLATVVSVPTPTRAVIDAGSKALTSDLLGLDGHGHVLGRDELSVSALSEEHGTLTSDAPHGLVVGDRVRIVPNHACVVSNLVDHVWIGDPDAEVRRWRVAARGMVL